MNVVIIKEKLKEGLDSVSKSGGENKELPILKNILVEAKNNRIKLVSTNLEIAITAFVPGKVIEEGETTVPLSLFLGIINGIQTERINLELKNGVLDIKTDNYNAKLQCVSSEEYPLIPKIKNKSSFISISSDIFRTATEQVMSASQILENRPDLNSVLFSLENEGLTLTSTDSFRLAEKRVKEGDFKQEEMENISCLVPLKTIMDASKIFKEGEVKIYIEESQILFESERVEMISRLLENKFPDYKQLIPKKAEAEVLINKGELLNALKLSSVLSSKTNEINIEKEGDKAIKIFSNEESVGENVYTLPAKIKGSFDKISFNWKYLSDGVRAIKSEEVYLGINDETKPALIREPNEGSFVYILMPILKS